MFSALALSAPAAAPPVYPTLPDWESLNPHYSTGAALVDLGETALAREVRAMRRALRHGNPTVNGYSGYFPEPYLQMREALRGNLAGRGRRYLEALGVRHVLVHDHEYAASRRGAIVRRRNRSLKQSTPASTILH